MRLKYRNMCTEVKQTKLEQKSTEQKTLKI